MRSVVGKENKIIYVIIFLLCLYGMPQRVCAGVPAAASDSDGE